MSYKEVFDIQLLNRRQFVKLTGGATLSLSALLAACGGSATNSSNISGPAAIEFLTVQQPTAAQPAVLSTITTAYTKTHTGTTFKSDYVPQASLYQKIQLLAGQDALPLLYNTPPTDLATTLAKNGEALDIAATFQQLGIYNELVHAFREYRVKPSHSVMRRFWSTENYLHVHYVRHERPIAIRYVVTAKRSGSHVLLFMVFAMLRSMVGQTQYILKISELSYVILTWSVLAGLSVRIP